ELWARDERARADYEAERSRLLEQRKRQSLAVADLRSRFQSGDKAAVEQYVTLVLGRVLYPPFFTVSYETAFDTATKTLVCDLVVPPPAALPTVRKYRIDRDTDKIVPEEIRQAQHEQLYDLALKQVTLGTLHNVLAATPEALLGGVVVNGWVTAVDPAT